MAEKKPKKTDETVEETAEATETEPAAEADIETPEAETPEAETPAAEEPVAEEPAVETPEPVAETPEPVAEAEEAPPDEAPEPVAEADEPAAEVEELVAEEPAAEEPAAEAAEPAPAAEAPAPPAQPSGPKPKGKRLPRAERRQRPRLKRGTAAAGGDRKPIVRLPKPEHERGRRNELQGTVVSAAMDKTIVVKVDTIKAHRRYQKVVRRSSKFHAHDEQNQAKPGDVVRIIETRPLSKRKNWRLAEIVEAAK